MHTASSIVLLVILSISTGLSANEEAKDPVAALEYSVQELRHAVGRWEVATDFLSPDGTTARSVNGQYEFEWVVEDRLLQGRNAIPELEMQSAILFYIREADAEIEMASVGADGKLWIMTGPLGGDTRTTQIFQSQSGADAQLRFTRYNVSEDGFESRMEYTEDGGETWQPGNHQVFRRQ